MYNNNVAVSVAYYCAVGCISKSASVAAVLNVQADNGAVVFIKCGCRYCRISALAYQAIT